MIKEQKIITGTKEELIEYFYNLVNTDLLFYTPTENLLNCKNGIIKQIEEIEILKNKMGVIFYLTYDPKSTKEEINFILKSSYVAIKDEKSNNQ